ncbi:putative NADPH dehydrogenase C23G7.10c [Cyphellophora attinorum]|uniref:Putative NADPH dehydrogenase C23G7.10c n=1 Tax=Cyphellophora attinorum TaxID=1664694 RepID=A0A0N0NLH9_9EURO|nr:putative NADPH dehydrogenase C23G7.10c [Phialophora attinorum]KPI39321.1 putative NADPH dehydrogenase C23G7.10c [Phialophora attinorum]
MTDETREAKGPPNGRSKEHKIIENKPAKGDKLGLTYYTPAQDPPAGTALSSNPPKLFQPLTIRGVTFQNRIFLSPLCQYSSENGHHTAWQMTHLGGIIQRGPGMTMVEATSVTPQGRITPEDSGLWLDSQKEPLRKIVEFAHSQSQIIGIQLGHAGRKGSTVAPWLSSGDTAFEEVNGWPDDVWAPSATAYNDKHPMPKAYTLEGIEELKKAFGDAIKRAVDVGFDLIELHFAHGYLLHEFLSPVTNKRTDKYGGSFENRTRLGVELVDLARSIIPKDMPLFVRISATDWLEKVDEVEASWTQEQSAKLALILAEHGVDLLDVSTGGLDPRAKMDSGPAYQARFAKFIKKEVGDKLLVTTVGAIKDGKIAQQQLDEGLDAVFSGRWFQKDPDLVWTFAEDLGVDINVANQIRWAFGGRGVGGPRKK